ncbi:MAG TPA: CDP-alcohol phosphatidyltransferase family protein [Ktedonobacteraceae bacterium]|nr:CDP-alcohol phosphatidyltransferase family protein [Ktedonobacteraceae bacterium]
MIHILNKTDNENQFVVDILSDLRKDNFGFQACICFLGSSWRKSHATAKGNPSLTNSWFSITIFIGLLALAILIFNLFFEGPIETLHVLPGFLFFVVWQQSDLYWHLGLNRQVGTGKQLSALSTATSVTFLRALSASYLLARFIGGIGTPSWLILLALVGGIITDILDGQIARRTHTQTKYGQIADAEADFCLYLAITGILIQQHILPFWFGMFLLLRFIIPLIAAIASYFLFAHPVRFGSTLWGKLSGLAFSFYLLLLLVPAKLIIITDLFHIPLMIVTMILLALATVAQILRNVGAFPII